MKCDILNSCTVITKDDKHFRYVIANGINLEELKNYFINEYKENFYKVIFNQSFGYLHK